MATFTRGETSIHYEVTGSGHPVLLLAPGGMLSSIALWSRCPFHPVHELADRFRVIAMDQRNAGQSRGPIDPTDGWDTYMGDHLALLDELHVERCHVLGMCIGSAFCLSLAAHAPDRLTAAVLAQPIGISGSNREVFLQMFDGWAEELAKVRPEVPRAAFSSFRHNLYDGQFAFSVSREQVRACKIPLLVLRGNDVYHPSDIAEEIARIAPRGELVESWKEGEAVARAVTRVKAFLAEHTPS
jgi:pimeloyl-ACP methyl ester carboxylesterase